MFSGDGSTVDEQVAALLRGEDGGSTRTIATAESCTGGLLAARLTDQVEKLVPVLLAATEVLPLTKLVPFQKVVLLVSSMLTCTPVTWSPPIRGLQA